METNLKSSFEHAKSMFEQGNFNTCNKEMLSLINVGYEVATCHYYIGLMYLNMKRYDEAINGFTKCIKLEPENINCLYSLGVVAEYQNNNELALSYYYKVLAINPNHTNSKNAITNLNGNQYANIQGNFNSTSLIDTKKSDDNIPQNKETDLKQKNIPTSLYDQLITAKDEDSRIAVEMIKATQMINRKPRYSAYFGSILFMILVIMGAVIFFYGGSFTLDERYGKYMYSMFTFSIIDVLLLIIFIPSLIYKLFKIKSTVVNIDKGFIEVKSGLISTQEPIFYVHRTELYDIHQNLMNIITGDGTFIFVVDIPGRPIKIGIKGLGKIKEMRELKVNLQNLRQQLRNTPVIKSGIYG